jgi:UDP-N-acetylmuramoylalanine--D-glutamate ligase
MSKFSVTEPTAVVGFGKTGRAVLDFLLAGRKKEETPIYLYNDAPVTDGEALKAKEIYENNNITFLIGEKQFERLQTVTRIVLSPGVNGRAPRFDRLRRQGVEIISEIELAFRLIEAPVIAVTGTNGKSTTVSLIHHFLTSCGFDSFLAGNIGQPVISEVEKISANSVVVLEVSSFQLEEVLQFRPHISVILNVTPDHLDRYPDMEAYLAAKLNLVGNQGENDYLVLNRDDEVLRERVKENRYGNAKQIWFTRSTGGPGTEDGSKVPDNNVWISGNALHMKREGVSESISLEKNPLRGVHNLENILAATAAARLAGAPIEGIEKSLPRFRGLPHRMESAGKIGNIEFINDSKATNVDAALKSIGSIDEPMVVILGGKDKGGDFRMLGPLISERVEHVLLVGHAADTIRRQLEQEVKNNDLQGKMHGVENFDEAVEKGRQLLAKKGGVVLLAPACASFDMFKNFEHRGEVFKEAVERLKKKIGAAASS